VKVNLLGVGCIHPDAVSGLPSLLYVRGFLVRKVSSMRKFVNSFVNFVKNEDGPTAVEYAVMLALIIVVCIGAIQLIGTNANSKFQTVANTLGS
jgi:pilus assembly protein Flp/PilA